MPVPTLAIGSLPISFLRTQLIETMVKFFATTSTFPYSWDNVTHAVWRKYPNPFASHVLSADVIDRQVDPVTGRSRSFCLSTCNNKLTAVNSRRFDNDQIIFKTGELAKMGFISKRLASLQQTESKRSLHVPQLLRVPEAFIIEQSTVDPKHRTMTTVTRNLSHRKLMVVEETQIFRPHGDSQQWTEVHTEARIISNTNWAPVRSKVEGFGLQKFKDNTIRVSRSLGIVGSLGNSISLLQSTKGLLHVVESLVQSVRS